MQGVEAGDWGVFPFNRENMALAGIEGYVPVLFPFFKPLQVFFEEAGVSLGEDLPVENGVVSKQSHCGLDVLVQVINVCDK